MDLQLQGQVAFIAGASRGIGRAIAAALIEEGADVVITGRDAAALEDTKTQLVAKGRGRALAVAGDLTEPARISTAIDAALREFGRLDHLIANLGSGRGTPGWNAVDAEWALTFDVNFFASTRLVRTALPHLLARHGGTILFIASITGVESRTAPLAYSAAKAALLNYSKNLARQLGPRHVRVNAIAPGNIFFDGGTWDKRQTGQPEEVRAMLAADVPQQRFGRPEEIAALAAFLCSARSGFATGGCYVMDGGQTRSL